MMAAFPLNHVARERIGGEAVTMVATVMIAGDITGAGKASQSIKMKNGSREDLAMHEMEVYQFS